MKLLIGVALFLISLPFLFNMAQGNLDIYLRGVGAILLSVGIALAFSSRELK